MSTRKSFNIETSRALGQRIKGIRKGRSQAEFSAVLGVDRATLANYESGRRIPNDAIVKKLSELSGQSIPELLFGRPVTNFQDIQDGINQSIAEHATARPGVIPRWAISDDEIALLVAFRICGWASQ